MRNEPIARTNRLTRATDKSIFGDGILYLCWSNEVKLGRKRRTRRRLTPATTDNKAFVYELLAFGTCTVLNLNLRTLDSFQPNLTAVY